MQREEFIKLREVTEQKNLITAGDLSDQSDRTLLFGYNTDRSDLHVYMKDKKIYTTCYYKDFQTEKIRIKEMYKINVKENSAYIPGKRAFIECCDYEFCKLLAERGEDVTFLSPDLSDFNEELASKPNHGNYYGLTWDDYTAQLREEINETESQYENNDIDR